MHSFAEMAKLVLCAETRLVRAYPGSFVVELRERRRREHLESPEGMCERLARTGVIQAEA